MVVMTMGRNRSWAASSRASLNGILPMRSTTKSRYRIAFFAERPMSINIPMRPKMSRPPPMKYTRSSAPTSASGTGSSRYTG